MFQTALMLRCGIICLFGLVFERAQGIEDGGGFFGDEAVFDDAVVAREIDDAFGAQACEVVGDAGRGGVECLCQFGNAAVAVKQQKKDGHTFGVGNQFENGRETLDFHIIVPFVCYMNA